MCIVYGLNYLDKTTLSYASVMGISEPKTKGGIDLVGDQYNWLGSLYVKNDMRCGYRPENLRADLCKGFTLVILAGNGPLLVFFNTFPWASTRPSISSCGVLFYHVSPL
jgi:hypothetical protein